eukprot:1308335-Amphidinium_carterae.1
MFPRVGLKGPLPGSQATVNALSVAGNALEGHLPDMHLSEFSTVLAHGNRFSCGLPRGTIQFKTLCDVERRVIHLAGPSNCLSCHKVHLGVTFVRMLGVPKGNSYDL